MRLTLARTAKPLAPALSQLHTLLTEEYRITYLQGLQKSTRSKAHNEQLYTILLATRSHLYQAIDQLLNSIGSVHQLL